jgi:microtubule-binding protein TANGLED1
MARLQELQYTVAGGAKVVSGVSLSPRSTRGYLCTSLRCKQETVRQVFLFCSNSMSEFVRFNPRFLGILCL